MAIKSIVGSKCSRNMLCKTLKVKISGDIFKMIYLKRFKILPIF